MQRQGDLLLIPTNDRPAHLSPVQSLVVLDGEHCHRLNGATRATGARRTSALLLAPGFYQVRRQRRFRPERSTSSAWD